MTDKITLKVLNDRGSPIIAAKIGDKPAAFMVDSGSFISVIWTSEADKFDLTYERPTLKMNGIGGLQVASIVTAQTLNLGDGEAHHVVFAVAGHHHGGQTVNGLPLAGLFGGDFLSGYSVSYDLPRHQIHLYKFRHCHDAAPDRSMKAARIPTTMMARDFTKVILPIAINGHKTEAVLDSGAERTVITARTARAAGVTRADLEKDRTARSYGVDDNTSVVFRHRFDSLTVGPFHFRHPLIGVIDTEHNLLGADFLRHHRVWIPRGEHWIQMEAVHAGGTAAPSPPSPAATR